MAFSSGVFSLLYNWATDKANAVKITASRMQAQQQDIADGLSKAILKDGTQTVTANIPMGGFKITGLGDATTGTDGLNRQAADARYVLTSAGTVPFTETTLPATPASGYGVMWEDSLGVFHVLNDAGTDIKIVDGAQALVSSGTASAAATLDITLPATYTHFRIALTEIEPATDNAILQARLSFNSGSSYASGASDYCWVADVVTGGGTQSVDSDSADSEFHLGEAQEIAGGYGSQWDITVDTQTTGSQFTTIRWDGLYATSSTAAAYKLTSGSGRCLSVAGVAATAQARATNVRFLYSSGNISFVRYSVYAWR